VQNYQSKRKIVQNIDMSNNNIFKNAQNYQSLRKIVQNIDYILVKEKIIAILCTTK